MNYLKIFLSILLCYNFTSLIVNCNTSRGLVVKLTYILSENYDIWKDCIGSHNKVIVDGKFVKLQSYLDDSNRTLKSISSDDSNHITSSTNELFAVSSTIYTFFKCKYTAIVVKLLKFINKSIKSCQFIKEPKNEGLIIEECIASTLANLKKMKPYFAKAIFDLFNFNNLSQHLKSSDQTLLISLLTMNTFIFNDDVLNTVKQYRTSSREYKSENENFIYIDDDDQHFNVLVLVNQLIYSLENFLCKNCFYSFTLLEYNVGHNIYIDIRSGSKCTNIKDKIEEFMINNFLTDLKKLNGLKTEDVVNDFENEDLDMYDSRHLLLKEVFSDKSGFESLIMEFGMATKKTIAEIVKEVETSHNIKKVLKYQIYLIEFIRNIFFVQIKSITDSTYNVFQKEAFDKLKTLVDYFVKFVDNLIPDNYPPILFRSICVTKNALITDLEQSKSNNLLLSKKTLQLLTLNSMICADTEHYDLYLKISLRDLIEKFTEFHRVKSFKQTFEILLQESNSPDDYYLLQIDNGKEIEDTYGIALIGTEACTLLATIREYLLLLWTLLEKIDSRKYFASQQEGRRSPTKKKHSLQDCLSPSFDNIFKYMAHVYKYTYDLRLQMILLPVLVHFQNTEWIFHTNNEEICKKITLIQRTLILAVNSLQYYEVNKCNVAELNKSIVDKITKYTDNNIHTQIVLKTKIYKYDNFQNSKYISDVIDTYTFRDIISEITHGTYLIDIQFFWNGLQKSVLNISQDVTQNIVSFHHILKFQTIILHFLVAKIYTKLEYTLKFPLNLTKCRITAIRKYLEELNRLEFSLPLVFGLRDICRSYLNIFENEDISEENIKLFQNQINDRLKAYGVIELDRKHTFKTFNDCYTSLKNDIEKFKKYLTHVSHNKLKIFVDDYGVPMIWKDYMVG